MFRRSHQLKSGQRTNDCSNNTNHSSNARMLRVRRIICQNTNFYLPKVGLLLVVVVIVVGLVFFTIVSNGRNNNNISILQQQERQQHSYNKRNELKYCFDAFDWKAFHNNNNNSDTVSCNCTDPVIPKPRVGDDGTLLYEIWYEFHRKQISDIHYAIIQQQQQQQNNNNNELDFIMLGDSITEHWNGTSNIGRIHRPEYRTIFDKYFNTNQAEVIRNNNDRRTKPLHGMTLGISGDTTNALLWRLQNGLLLLLPKEDPTERIIVKTKGFIVLIGTNNIGKNNCSQRSVVEGIVSILQYIESIYGSTTIPIIVHALLPRRNYYNPTNRQQNYQLGWMNTRIERINKELEAICTNHSNWHYVNVNTIFLRPQQIQNNTTTTINQTNIQSYSSSSSSTSTSRYEIIPEMMDDGLHPTVLGCDTWGPLLLDAVTKYFIHNTNITDLEKTNKQ